MLTFSYAMQTARATSPSKISLRGWDDSRYIALAIEGDQPSHDVALDDAEVRDLIAALVNARLRTLESRLENARPLEAAHDSTA